MYNYTIKLTENNDILLLNEQGEQVPVTSLLDLCGDRRVLAFDAPMGTGKTTLIKKICETMGTDDIVNSPSFAIVNVYDIANPTDASHSQEVYHFDCYRLKDIREAYDFGAEDYLYSGNWCFIEWPDIIEPLLPEDTVRITIRTQENGDRFLTLE